jgi:hypothetical protein
MRSLQIFLLVILLTACAHKQTAPNPKAPEEDVTLEDSATAPEENIDIPGLQRSLKMDHAVESLGFKEKMFSTCAVGYGYSSSHRCRNLQFTVLNFRLQCRDSEGTVSLVTNEELTPVAAQPVRWAVGSIKGQINTDGEGYGQVVLIAPKSQRSARVRLSTANDFLLMRADQIKRVVVPQFWCR